MPEQNKPFVITDRRKFTLDGTPRADFEPSAENEEQEQAAAPIPVPAAEPEQPAVEPPATDQATAAFDQPQPEDDLPPALTEEQKSQARLAYESTAERLDTAIRATNPGMDPIPPMDFERLVQSVYMTAIVQLGGSTPEGEQPRVDILGARQSIDMLAVLDEKTRGNLTEAEARLLENALFDVRMAFLEVTQALSRAAAAKAPGVPGMPGARPGPSIVR